MKILVLVLFALTPMASAFQIPSAFRSLRVDADGVFYLEYQPRNDKDGYIQLTDRDGLATLALLRKIIIEDYNGANRASVKPNAKVQDWDALKPVVLYAMNRSLATLKGKARADLVALKKAIENDTPTYGWVVKDLQAFLADHALSREYSFVAKNDKTRKTHEGKGALSKYGFANPEREMLSVFRLEHWVTAKSSFSFFPQNSEKLKKQIRKQFDDSRARTGAGGVSLLTEANTH